MVAGAPLGGTAGEGGAPDLSAFNRWLCTSRLRAAGGVALFGGALHYTGVEGIALEALLAVCAGLVIVSAIGLLVRPLDRAPRLFFYGQTLADLLAVTIGIGVAAEGLMAILIRPIYALIIVPSSLVSVPGGLAVAALATIGHSVLFVLEHGSVDLSARSLEFATPPFLFFLIAQQGFFYGAHLRRKNVMLARLAERLEEHRQRVAAEARMSAALVDVARTLSSSLETPELQARLNWTTRKQLGADWSGTFVVDTERDTFRLVAGTDATTGDDVERVSFPLRGWDAVRRLRKEALVVLTGAEAGTIPGIFTGGRDLKTILLAALYRNRSLAGFLVVGYRELKADAPELPTALLAGIAEHAAIALRNAGLMEEVRLASEMKSEFVGAISHELRSPLNVMLGYSEMLADGAFGELTEAQLDVVERTRSYTVALHEMITALLDLNRLEAGRLPVAPAEVSPVALLHQVCEQLPEDWVKPGVELRRAIVPDLPDIETDPGKLKTVVRNLLHNALKFTERGHVVLGAGMGQSGELVITVTDTGRGIAPGAIGYIFDMFRQVPGAGGGGVGLGLHLVRRLLHVLGGTITVESEVGMGTCFTISVPLRLPRVASAAEAPAASAVRPRAGRDAGPGGAAMVG